jgi:hypothetical protein
MVVLTVVSKEGLEGPASDFGTPLWLSAATCVVVTDTAIPRSDRVLIAARLISAIIAPIWLYHWSRCPGTGITDMTIRDVLSTAVASPIRSSLKWSSLTPVITDLKNRPCHHRFGHTADAIIAGMWSPAPSCPSPT